ncbi:MAG: acetyltransferase [Coriobacteriia bacterium]|nr:acetyltransferase [Coriobacteriia bacterium]
MRVIVIGAGGHAKVVIDAAVRAGFRIAGVVDESGTPGQVLGHPTVSEVPPDAEAFVVAIGDNAKRRDRFEHYMSLGLNPVAVVHPDAIIAEDVTVDPGAVIFAGVVVNSSARIGADVILNTGCTVDHDCVIGDHAHVGPGANLCGQVSVGEGALVGVGACATPGARIGAWATVGAGAAVVDPIPDGVTVVGVPARELPPT